MLTIVSCTFASFRSPYSNVLARVLSRTIKTKRSRAGQELAGPGPAYRVYKTMKYYSRARKRQPARMARTDKDLTAGGGPPAGLGPGQPPSQAGRILLDHHAGFKCTGCRRIFADFYKLKRHKTHYKLRFTACATSKGLELINTFRRDLATGLNKEIPMLPQGSAFIQDGGGRRRRN